MGVVYSRNNIKYVKSNMSLKKTLKRRAELIADIPTLVEQKDWRTRCDSIGFFQHYGECWNDCIQMMLLFTDGIKELTQPFLYYSVITTDYVSTKLPNHLIELGYVYLTSLQRRFKRHYNLEMNRQKIIAECDEDDILLFQKLKKLEESSKSYKGIDAISGAITAHNIIEGKSIGYNRKYYYPGGHSDLFIKYALSLFSIDTNKDYKGIPSVSIKSFDLINKSKIIYSVYKRYHPFLDNPKDFPLKELSTVIQHNTNAIIHAYSMHVVLYYKCGGKEYYYDDNKGVIPFPWTKFFNISEWMMILEKTEEEVINNIYYSNCHIELTYKSHDYAYSEYPCIYTQHSNNFTIYTFSPIDGKLLIFAVSLGDDRSTYPINDASEDVYIVGIPEKIHHKNVLTCITVNNPLESTINTNTYIPSALRTMGGSVNRIKRSTYKRNRRVIHRKTRTRR